MLNPLFFAMQLGKAGCKSSMLLFKLTAAGAKTCKYLSKSFQDPLKLQCHACTRKCVCVGGGCGFSSRGINKSLDIKYTPKQSQD